MSELPLGPDTWQSGDAGLDELLAEIAARVQAGEAVDIEAYARHFPQHAEEVRRLLPAMRAMAGLGMSAVADSSGGPPQAAVAAIPAVLGDFRILREIGCGGMGVVYEVLDCKRNVRLALKMLRDPSPPAVLRLKREFRSLANLGHRNLVVLDRLFCVDGQWFFTMELIRGRNFTQYVRVAVGPGDATEWLPPETQPAARITEPPQSTFSGASAHDARLRHALEQVALGLNALHQARMLHRDVKPSNVLVSEEGRVVLVDFGLVAELKEAYPRGAPAGTWAGTQPYMSPEQMAGEPLTYASDWYSVGVMLYQSLTGCLPFAGDVATVLSQKRAGPPQGLLDAVPPQQHDLAALCIDLLDPEPGRRPTGSEVRGRIRGQNSEGGAVSLEDTEDDRPVFVGRRQQLAELQRALDDVCAGLSLRVYVSGRPGMGKTALVERFLSAAQPAGEVIVLQGRCYEREAMPYKALDSLVDAIIRHLNTLSDAEVGQILPEDLCSLVRVFPALLQVAGLACVASRGIIPADDRESRTRAIASLRGILKHLADRAVTVLVVDDLQWGDPDSAAFLTELLAPPEPPAVLFLACYRSDDRQQSECLQALLREGARKDRSVPQREIVVDELTPEEAQQLAAQLLGASEKLAGEVAGLSSQIGGSPYLISEFARRAKREGRHMLAAGGGPADLVSMLRRRIEQLPAAARRLLGTIAVSGHPIRLDLACRVAGLGLEPDVAVAMLRSENLIRTLGGAVHKVAVYHDCIREAATAHFTLHERKRLHLQIATVLENAADTDPAEMCRHLEIAGDYDRAGHYALVAAERAARALAFDQAAAMYRAALEWRTPTVQEEWWLRQTLAEALSHAGRSAEAAEQYVALASCEDPIVKTEMQRRAAMHYLIGGHIDKGRLWLDRVLKDAGIPVPQGRWQTVLSLLISRARLRLRGLELRPPRKLRRGSDQARFDAYWCAIVGLSVIDPFRAAYYVARNLLLTLRQGDPGLAARALAMEAFNTALAGPRAHKRTRDLLDRAAMLSEQAADPYTRALLQLIKGAAAFLEGDWRATLAHGRDSERSLRKHCSAVFWELTTAQLFQLWSLCWLGRFNELARRVRDALEEAKDRGNLYALLNMGTFVQPYLRLLADQPEAAACELDALMAQWSRHGLDVQHTSSLIVKAHIAMCQGFGDAALEAVTELRAALFRSGQWRMQYYRVLFKDCRARALLIAARTAPNRRPLLKAAARLGRSLEREDYPCAAGFGRLIRAAVVSADGRHDPAAALLQSAVAVFEQTGMAFYAAMARRRLGKLLAGQAGHEMVDEAVTWMRSENVQNVERITDLFCPWIEEKR